MDAPEIELSVLWSTPRLSEREVRRLGELLRADLDWARVFGILTTHRTLGIAWHNTLEHLIAERSALAISHFLLPMKVMYDGQQVLAEEQIEHTLELLAALDASSVPVATLKGGAVARMAYPSLGMRVFQDNDLLVPRARLAEAGDVLRRLGYVQGGWDYAAGVVRPARRSDVLLFPLNSHQTHPYKRATPGARVLECHRIDLHFSIDLLTSNHTDETVIDLLGRRVAVGEPPMWALHPQDMFVFMCAHFAREARHYADVVKHKDLQLCKLVDLVALLDGPLCPPDAPALAARARELGMYPEVAYAMAFVAELFPARVNQAMADTFRVGSGAGLDEVLDTQGRVHRWRLTLPERFFSPNRLAGLIGPDGDPAERSAARPAAARG
ncbi:nucleotidyltransferase family protein [Dactylosporangium sp. CA-139066]|uniref:nucleotidyltransferase family protein n=1 Tax=Dactylosporangium sp. CA-139066 TaxID=3239930 RepID=UPI003D8DCA68